MPSNPISFEANGLYIFLTDIGAERQFHWGFYLAKGPKNGVIFHMINSVRTGDKWEYQAKSSNTVPYSKMLLLALNIAVIEPELHDALAQRLPAVSSDGAITCRVWLRNALQELDDEGFIKLIASVDKVEEEAVIGARNNMLRKQRTAVRSEHCVA